MDGCYRISDSIERLIYAVLTVYCPRSTDSAVLLVDPKTHPTRNIL